MSLTGDVNTLALADLVQVSALNRRTCQIHVIAPHAEGDLFLERGQVVHAWWGDLVGAEAVYAMLNTPDVGFHVRGEVTVSARTVAASWEQLVLEAARRFDHDSVPRPTARTSDRWRIPRDTAPTLQRLRSSESSPSLRTSDFAQPLRTNDFAGPLRTSDFARPIGLADGVRKGPPRALWIAAATLLTVALALLTGRLLAAHRHTRTMGASSPIATPLAVDASELTGPGDVPPALLSGAPPPLPRSEWAVAPTIVCRLTIGSDGSVQQARVYRSRLELAAFEDAALAAVENYRFMPARRDGAAVASTINWPVTFAAPGQATRTVHIKGSDTIGGALAPALGRAFHEQHQDIEISVEALGSKTAFIGLFDGTADLGASSRPVNAEELKQAARLGITLRELVIAYDGIAVIVNPKNRVGGLTLDQAARIFTGEVRDWSAVGGAQAPIEVIARPSYSGTHSFFRDKVLRRGDPKGTQDFTRGARIIEDNKELIAAVAADENAIAFVGHGWLAPSVRALPIEGVLPSTATIRDGSYPIYRPLLFYTRGTPNRDGAAFLSFVLGAAGQAIVRDNGFVPVDAPGAIAVRGDDAPGVPREPLRIGFDTGGSKLSAAAYATLAALARQSHQGDLLVVGHSDADGDPLRNHRLARARAERVATALVAFGVPAAHVSIENDDADAPVASNSNAAGRRLNRRADVFLLPR